MFGFTVYLPLECVFLFALENTIKKRIRLVYERRGNFKCTVAHLIIAVYSARFFAGAFTIL